MFQRFSIGLVFLACATTSVAAQFPVPGAGDSLVPDRVEAALDAWRAEHGSAWQYRFDAETGFARFVFGGSAAAPFEPRDDADFYSLARHWLGATQELHGIELANLVEDGVVFLPLSLAGSTDKYTVQFRQVKHGVPVLDGYANVLFANDGTLLSIDTTGVRALSQVDTTPSLDARAATRIALGWFASDAQREATVIGQPKLMIDQSVRGKFRLPRLAWELTVLAEADGEAIGYVYRVDAHDGTQSSRASAVHHFDVSGNVKSFATPGNFPDAASNPETSQNMPYLAVTSAQGNAKTDANGNFTIVGASAPVSATFRFQSGTFATVNNNAGSAYSKVQNLTAASGNNVVLNSPVDDFVTAQANSFLWIGKMRDWTRSVNPADATCDFLATSNVNISSTCNAYYNGSSVNFFRSGGGCVNTSYSSVVLHEMGHWLNDRYSSGNGADGFGEGNADNFSTFILDDPIVGRNFCGTNCNIRDGNNTRQFCGDTNGGCYGEVHADGEVLMGACWKVRTRLKNTLGASAGSQAANVLFNAWMNAYNDMQIKSIVEIHWLTLDDDDGNITNGTPNYVDIDLGFRAQGFPGYTLSFVTLTNVSQVASYSGFGPFPISADAVASQNPPVSSVAIKWRTKGTTTFQTSPMTLVSGTTWSGSIPAQPCNSTLEYYVLGTDSVGKTGTFPDQAPIYLSTAEIAHTGVLYANDFESGAAGWTHGANAGSDDWQLSTQVGVVISAGKVGDPTAPASSGSSVFGTDLGAGADDGLYEADQIEWLRSPSIDCTGADNVHLRFKRWLNAQKSNNDAASIRVNGTLVWTNLALFDTFDTAWVPMDLDISSIADGNPSVQIEFKLKTDGSAQYGGWNVDDFELSAYSCSPTCPVRVNYCAGKPNSNGWIPTIASTGTPQLSTQNFQIELSDGTYSKLAVVFWSSAPLNAPFLGGTLCVAPPITRGTPLTTSPTGSASYPINITPQMVGTTLYYQWWMRDPQDQDFVGLSDGLQVQFCN
ncbi:MAG: hypothetical protein L6Q99_18105 [Planctomycetes bacterium]|nr:hypothetical protein [Planctomycetota bacterium]